MERLVVLAPNWLGDVVMALPAFDAIRRWRPDAHLAVAARASVAPLLTLSTGIDEVIALTGRGDWRDGAGRRADASRLRAGRFDAAVLFPNSFHAAWLARRAAIPERWGYARDLRGWLLTRAIPPRRGVTQAAYYLDLVTALGAPTVPLTASLIIPEALSTNTETTLRHSGWQGEPIVAFAPGAAFGPAKRWPPSRVGLVAAQLRAAEAVTPVFVGTAADRDAIDEAVAAFRADSRGDARVIDLGGRTDLPTLAAVLARCEAVLSNDSGAMHVAAAVGVPVAAIFGPTDERATAPLPHPSGRAVALLTGHAECRPCHLRECPIDHRCMTSISVSHVASRMQSLMGAPRPEGGQT
jgi:heptosyltransferase-2